MGYFEATMHVGIAFKVDSLFKLVIPALILTSTIWNFGALLQYLHSCLPLQIRILGLHCNTYTRTYFYQLEFCTYTYLYKLGFWGLVIILAFNTNIITIFVFFHFIFFLFIT